RRHQDDGQCAPQGPGLAKQDHHPLGPDHARERQAVLLPRFALLIIYRHHRPSMKTIKGPAIFLAQFMGDQAPFDTLANLAAWAAGLGYEGIQLPTDKRLFDLELAADSQTYCDEVKGVL